MIEVCLEQVAKTAVHVQATQTVSILYQEKFVYCWRLKRIFLNIQYPIYRHIAVE